METDLQKIIDDFVDAPDFPGNFVSPDYQRNVSVEVIRKVSSKYPLNDIRKFVELIQNYGTWERQKLGRMVIEEGIDLVSQALSSPFSDEVPQYHGALKEKLEYERIKGEGVGEADLEQATIQLQRGCFLWNSRQEASRWDLKGYIEDVEGRGGETFHVQGHSVAISGFVKSLKRNIGKVTEMRKESVSKVYDNISGGTKPCGCW